MPEGPEIHRYADMLDTGLAGQPIRALTARTRVARDWLEKHPGAFDGQKVVAVRAHGKNLLGRVTGDLFFYSHQMMWGRWEVLPADPAPGPDRRERARITTEDCVALLFSAPRFELGSGDPYEAIPYLRTLGPDILPYPDQGPFNVAGFVRRLEGPDLAAQTIGAALLNQTIVAGIGNYLRAEILFACRIDPWRPVGDLTADQRECLAQTAPRLARMAYETRATASVDDRTRMAGDPSLVYRLDNEVGTRHYIFRRTNLPCLTCGDTVRQLRQPTWHDEEGERTRIIYFCPTCQGVALPEKKRRKKAAVIQP